MRNNNRNLWREEKRTDSISSTKKWKIYAVIVMQKTIFFGLQSVVKCVNVHLRHLKSLINNVNKCAQYLIKKIELKITKN